MNVKKAFPNGNLIEEVYMEPAPGYVISNKVRRLRRILYGLKQTLRAYYFKFSSTMQCLDFKSNLYDSALFIRQTFR